MTNVNIQMYPQYTYDSGVGAIVAILYYQASEYYGMLYQNDYAVVFGATQNVTSTPYPTFTDINSALSYYAAIECSALVTQINTNASATVYTGYNTPVFTPPSVAAALSMFATVAKTGSYTDLINKPTIPTATRTFNNPTRSLNTAFQISTTQDAIVSYAVDIGATLSLVSGATGTVTLQYADDSGFTTNVKSVNESVNGNTGTLTIGLGLTQTGTAAVSGSIPAGKYVKIVTANTAGTPTFTFRLAQEVLI